MQLGLAAVRCGYRVITFDTLASTNDEAMRFARDGDPGKLWITATGQHAGRGRLGRTWHSPRGNLHASLLLLDAAPLECLAQLGFVCGVALAHSLSARLGDRLALKWPNDVLLDGAKIAGILLESSSVNGCRVTVAGIGVNCEEYPAVLPYAATSLKASGFAYPANEVFEGLSNEFSQWIEAWDRGLNFSKIRDEWLKFAGGIGTSISVLCTGERVTGVFHGIDAQGRLVLETPVGEKIIDAGDVTMPQITAPPGAQGQE